MKIPEALAIDRIMEVLEKLAPVEWGSIRPGEAQRNRLDYAPVIVWRFNYTSTAEDDLRGIEKKICDEIMHFRGRVKWCIEKPGRNIVLTTAKVMEMEKSPSFQSGAEVLNSLAATDPNHGNDAHADLVAIVEVLCRLAAKCDRQS